jgi:hypothetical protein
MPDIACPNCSARFSYPTQQAGKRMECSKCQTVFAIPKNPPEVQADQIGAGEAIRLMRVQKQAEDAAFLRKLAIIGAAIIGIVLIALTIYFLTRDTWEQDNLSKLAALKGEAESAEKAGDYRGAASKCSELLALIGNRQVQDARLQEIKAWADKTNPVVVKELTVQQQSEKREAEARQQTELQRLALERQEITQKQQMQAQREEQERAQLKEKLAQEERARLLEAEKKRLAALPKDEDLETKGTWKANFETVGTYARVSGWTAEGTITNTSNAPILEVELRVDFIGIILCRHDADNKLVFKADDKFHMATGTDKFKNLRPGETRQFKLIIPRDRNQKPDAEGWEPCDGKALSAVFESHITKKE